MKTDEVAAVHDEDSHSPSSENLTTTEELPAKMGARNKPSPQSKQDDPLSQESAEALFFDVTDAVGMDDYPEEIKIAESPAPPAARSLLDMPPAQLQAELAAPAPAPAAIAPPPPPSNIIECPCPPDVLMPVEGYQLWSGNARYLHLVATRQPEFLQVAGRSEQARIALEILHAIQLDGGRFLTAIDIPPTENALPTNNSSIVRTTVWELMKETEVLGQLGKALRTTEGEARKQEKKEKKQRRKEKKRKRKERRRARRRERALVVEASDEEQVSPSTLGALQSLYYVPSYYPVAEDHSKNSLECESDSILTSSSSSSEEEPTALPVAKRRVVRKSKAGVAPSPVARAAAKKPEAASAEKNKEISFHYKPKPMKSQQAALDNEGECNLPKGVTVRPSGKWQAQTYFAGQSRYVGVYDTSRLAARAYVVVQDFLRQYRDDHTITKESPKEELAIIFANARRAADDAVRELKDSLKSNELTTLTTTASTASTVVAPAPTPHPAIAPLADAVVPASSPSQPLNITTI